MEKETKRRHLPFLTSKAKAMQLYALDMSTDDFIEMGYDVWRSIGNIATDISRYYVKAPDDMVIELPAKCEFVMSVIAVDRLPNMSAYDSGGIKDRHLPATTVASNIPDMNQSLTNSDGRSVNYIMIADNSIKLTSPNLINSDILIVYRSMTLDEDGLPLLNDKEVAAIAAEVTKRNTIRQSFMGIGSKNKQRDYLTQYIIAEADRLIVAAKIDENISDNALDKLLDIRSSWDRKVFGHKYNFNR